MSVLLHYSPIKWSPTNLSGHFAPKAFLDILDAFDVEYYEGADNLDVPLDIEVERQGLKDLRATLMTGDCSEEQDEIYRYGLNALNLTHNDFIKELTEILSTKTDWLRLSWF